MEFKMKCHFTCRYCISLHFKMFFTFVAVSFVSSPFLPFPSSHVPYAALYHRLHFSTLLSWLIIARDKGPHEAWYKHKGALILLLVTKVWIYSSSHEDSFHTSDSPGDNVASNWNNEGFGPVALWIELHNLAYFIFCSSFSLCVWVCVLILPIWFCFRCLWVLFSRRVLLHLSSFPIFHENYQAKDQKLFCEKQIV